jgi:hypothetical protein
MVRRADRSCASLVGQPQFVMVAGAAARLGDPGGVLVADDTGFEKSGREV